MMTKIFFTTREWTIDKDCKLAHVTACDVDIDDFIYEFNPFYILDCLEYSDIVEYRDNPTEVDDRLGTLELYTDTFQVEYKYDGWRFIIDNIYAKDIISGYYSGIIISSLSDYIDDYIEGYEGMGD